MSVEAGKAAVGVYARAPAAPFVRAQLVGRFPLASTLALYTAAFLALSAPWLSGAVTIPWDAKAQFQPQLQFLAKSLAEGQSPLWTPNVFAGWPQIADPQSMLFSPLHWLLAFVDPAMQFRSVDAVTFFALFLGGCGLILYARDRGWGSAGALVAALTFTSGCSAAARIQHTSEILSLCYLPFALWLLRRALDRASLRLGLAAGLAAGLMATGRDQVALLGLYLLAGVVLADWMSGGFSRIRASVAPLAGVALAGAIVAGVPVLLTALLAADSNRPEIAYAVAVRGSLHPAHLLTLAFSDLFATNSPQIGFWGPPSSVWGPSDLNLAQNMGELYVGAVPVVLLGIGLIRGYSREREIRFFALALALALLYALGRYTPAYRAFYELLPGVSFYRRPADATFLIGTLLAILSGDLVKRFLAQPADAPPARRREALVGFLFAAVILGSAAGVAVWIGKLEAAIAPILIGIGWAVLAIAALALSRRLRGMPFAAASVLSLTVAADLGWNNAPNISTGLPASFYDALRPDTANDTVALIKSRLRAAAAPGHRDRVELVGISYHWPNLALVHGFDHVFGQNPLRFRDFKQATGVGDTVATAEQRRFSPLYPSYHSPFADLFGVRVIATGVPVEQIDTASKPGDLVFLGRTREAYLYENPRALPRAMVLTDWRLADFAELMRTGWPDVDPGRTVLLERPPPALPAPASANPGSARIVAYENTEVIVDTETPAGGVLLLTDVWHPWWRAEVDGEDVPILKADVLFRAVPLTPGHHRVRFTFHPLAGAFEELAARLRAKFTAAPR
jgi:Bacterial membrane protein YfhO